MQSTEQKLREALPPLHAGCLPTLNQDPYPALGDWWVQLWDGSGDDAKVIARVYGNSPEQAKQRAEAMCQALALPTAAPVGERELPELPTPYGLFNINGPDGHRISGFTAYQMRAYALSALSAGDAADGLPPLKSVCHIGCDTCIDAGKCAHTVHKQLTRATAPTQSMCGFPQLPEPYRALDKNLSHPILRQVLFAPGEYFTADQMTAYATAAVQPFKEDADRYRWLREQHWSNSDICCVNKPKQNVRLGGICPSGDLLDAAIDAAMRKGQL